MVKECKKDWILMNQSNVQKVFDYDAKTGDLIRRSSNKRTGTINSLGYKYTKFNKTTVPCHRLIYIWHKGDIPDHYHIDHIDHDRSNNRIENLQAIPPHENLGKRIHSKYKNVHKNKNGTKWVAKVIIRLGEYNTQEDAQKAIEKYHSK